MRKCQVCKRRNLNKSDPWCGDCYASSQLILNGSWSVPELAKWAADRARKFTPAPAESPPPPPREEKE